MLLVPVKRSKFELLASVKRSKFELLASVKRSKFELLASVKRSKFELLASVKRSKFELLGTSLLYFSLVWFSAVVKSSSLVTQFPYCAVASTDSRYLDVTLIAHT